MAHLAHKIELKPTPEQAVYFCKACGVARFAYNWGLAEWERMRQGGEQPNWMTLKKRLNAIKRKQFPWMYEVTKCAPEAALADLGQAFANYFRDVKKPRGTRKAQYPKFKKKGKCRDKFYLSNDQFSVTGQEITMPHLGVVRMQEALRVEGKVLSATVSRSADRWLVAIVVEQSDQPPFNQTTQRENQAWVGIDLGIESAVTLSTGKKYKSPKSLAKHLKQLRRSNRALHRKVLGGRNREKAKLKVSRLHRRIANIRLDFLHKTTTAITRKFQNICLEDLNVKGMMANRKLARALADVGLGELRRQLAYKAERREGAVRYVSRFFPSSKQCRKCHTINQSITLKDRMFACPNAECRHREDRDRHAARQVESECRKQTTVGRTGSHACGQPASTPAKRSRFGSRKLTGGSRKHVDAQEIVTQTAS